MQNKQVQVIAVTGGKGGVGKTNVSVNMAIAMSRMGRRVLLMDADLGLANVDVLLGLSPKKNLADVIKGQATLDEVMIEGPGGVRIIPASSGTQSMVELTPMEHAGLIRAFSDVQFPLDVLIVDTAAGISDSVISFVRAAQEVLMVVCDEPSSITDAYAMMKLLNRDYDMFRFKVLANMTHTPQEGQLMFKKLQAVCDRFLDVSLQYVGSVPYDENVRRAVKRQRPIVDALPGSAAGRAYIELAKRAMTWKVPRSARGHLEFFVEQLVNTSE